VVESTSKGQLLSEADLVRIEKAHPNGLSSAQIIQIFQQRGVKLSEATFRKYVQLGLLPRCRRVGSKGKHRGSRGVYPCATVRRINAIKRLMARSYTIEEIQQSFSNFKARIDSVESALDELFKGFEREIGRPQFDHAKRRTLSGDIREARQTANDLVRRLIQIESHISFPDKTQAASGGGNLSDI
jgi:hypothetical protein